MGGRQLIPGIRATREAMFRGQIKINEVWIKEGRKGIKIEEIQRLGEVKGIPVLYKKGALLDELLPGIAHQGIVALAEGFTYVDLNGIITSSSKETTPHQGLIVAADHITDEGNLGALIRTAAFFKAHGLVLPKKRSAKITEKVLKRSAGSLVDLPVARVVNLGRALDILKNKGFWIIGAAGEDPETIYHFDWNRDVVLVLGSEDKGLSPLVRNRCHQLVSIPSYGAVNSLNVSVAAGVILSEIVRQRKMKGL
jgi:23S rRNA (guanosine2251-2'-O)-methyltransferase